MFTNQVLMLLLCIFVLSISLSRCDDDNIYLTIEKMMSGGGKGSPGDRGPMGPPGPPGDMGPTGTCECDEEPIEKLEKDVAIINAVLEETKAQRVLFEFTQDPDKCSVGIKTGKLPNKNMISSTMARPQGFEAFRGRLDNPSNSATNYGVWAAGAVNGSIDQWIQVDLTNPRKVTGIITQGRQFFDHWVTSFRIAYGDTTTSLRYIKQNNQNKVFRGNSDRTTYRINLFPEPITARYFRLYIASVFDHGSMRMELVTC